MRRTTSLTAACLLGLALLAPTTSATAAAETCRGEAATIVGTTPTLTGTEGRDVIVSGDSGDVFGLGGDDLICVRGSGGNSNLLSVDAGSGNDLVDTTGIGGGYYVTAILGAGSDTFVGGKSADSVLTGNGETPMIDAEPDSVDTGTGNDTIVTGSTAGPNHDRVEAGVGTDYIDLTTPGVAADGLVSGGPGRDDLTVREGISGDVAVDMTAGTLTTSAGSAAFSSLEEVSLTVGSAKLTYRGTDADDTLTVNPRDGVPILDVATLGGADTIVVNPASVAAGSRIDAGRGQDQFVAAKEDGSLELNLGFYKRFAVDGVAVATIDGIENAFLMAPEVTMVGSNTDNSLYFNGCRATIRGGHGDDYLNNIGDYYFDSYSFDCKAAAEMSGGPGRDHLRGGSGNDRLDGEGGNDRIEGRSGADRIRGGGGDDRMDGGEGRDHIRGDKGLDKLFGEAADDTLIGGAGRDLADGSKGRDRCSAERERRCER